MTKWSDAGVTDKAKQATKVLPQQAMAHICSACTRKTAHWASQQQTAATHRAQGWPDLLLGKCDVLAQQLLWQDVRVLWLHLLLLVILSTIRVAARMAAHHKLCQALVLHGVHNVTHYAQDIKPAAVPRCKPCEQVHAFTQGCQLRQPFVYIDTKAAETGPGMHRPFFLR
jgi:hypothetical protein